MVCFHCQLLSIYIIMESSTPGYNCTHLISNGSRILLCLTGSDQLALSRLRTRALMHLSRGLLVDSHLRTFVSDTSLIPVSTRGTFSVGVVLTTTQHSPPPTGEVALSPQTSLAGTCQGKSSFLEMCITLLYTDELAYCLDTRTCFQTTLAQ